VPRNNFKNRKAPIKQEEKRERPLPVKLVRIEEEKQKDA
jgi:hypothetical protein